MARTALLYVLPGFLIATFWARLEEGGEEQSRFLWIAALALLPALVRPVWARVVVLLVVSALAVRVALHASVFDALPLRDEDFLGPASSRLWNGFKAFFEVSLPFRAGDHPDMHGALLLGVFAFCVVLAFAIGARRPLLASAALIAGAGWPATILSGGADLARGAVVLAAALLLFAGMRSLPTLDLRQPVLAGAAVVLGALVLSTSPSVARSEFVDGWRTWDIRSLSKASVGVEYVWNSNYGGIKFPDKPTKVLTIDAPDRPVYWRATTLDTFTRGRWVEDLFGRPPPILANGVDDLSDEVLLPAAAHSRRNWRKSLVHVDALRDNRLIGASVPVAYDTEGRDVTYWAGNVAEVDGGTQRGDEYTVWSYAPEPTPQQLARSKPTYPDFINAPFISLDGVEMPPFGQAGRERVLADVFRRDPRLAPYGRLYREARRVVGTPRNPYAAVVALETWFRGQGGFVYDEQPPLRAGTPPLVSFVTSTKRGYCQHFAGAMAVMLRELGIPAHVAAGFTAGHYDRQEKRWIVVDRNAHTWVEVWFKGYGWLPFDPTPGRGQLGATYTSSSFTFDVGGAQQAIVGAGGRTRDLFRESQRSDRPRGADPGGARPGGSAAGRGNRAGRGIVTLLIALALAVALVLTVLKLARRGVRYLTRDPRRLAGATRRDLVGFMADQGVPVPVSATPTELGQILERQFGVHSARLVDALTLARFGRPEGAAEAARDARRELRRVRKALRGRLSMPRRTRGLLSLRSLTA